MDDDCLGEGCGRDCVDDKSEICTGNSSCVESKKVKGVKKVVTRTELTFENLDRCRIDEIPVIKKVRYFKSKDHNIFTIEMDKVALKSEDDKNFTLENKIDTLPPGHWRLRGDRYIPFEIPYPRGELGKLCIR